MDKTRIDGAGKEVVGAAKEAAGKLTGDRRLQAEGVVEKTAGRVQSAAARLAESLRRGEGA